MNGLAKLRLFIELKENLNKGLDTANKKIKKTTGDIQSKLNDFKMKNIEAFDAITSKVPGVGSAMAALANPYTLAAGAALLFGTMAVKATRHALEWRDSMAQINVTAQKTPEELSKLSDKILKIGANNVMPLKDAPKGFNTLISALDDADLALKSLDPTLKAAKAGYTDIEITAGAAAKTMSSTGIKDATKVYDVLFATMKAGSAEFRDIANYLPKVIPMARNVGFQFEETAGSFAFLTKSLKPEAAATALEGMMRAMSNANVVKNFKDIGINIFDIETGKARPILDILTDLNTSMAGLSDKQKMLKFDQLGLDQSATLGFSKLIQDLPQVNKDINDVINSQGALNQAYIDSKTPLDSWKEIQNKIQFGMIKMGQLFLPIVSKIGEGILNVIYYFKNLYKESTLFRDILSVIGKAFEWAFKIAIIPIKGTINYIKLAWKAIFDVTAALNGWFEKITGIKGGFSSLYNHIRPYLIWIKEFIGSIWNILYDIVTLNFKGVKERIQNFKMPDIGEIRQRITVETDDPSELDGSPITPTDGGEPTPENPVGDLQTISGGSQTKNVAINIDSFVKGFNPTHQSINSMNKDELERWMIEMFLRVVRSAETAL